MRNPALDAWGGYDLDDPYPLFARVQRTARCTRSRWPTGTPPG